MAIRSQNCVNIPSEFVTVDGSRWIISANHAHSEDTANYGVSLRVIGTDFDGNAFHSMSITLPRAVFMALASRVVAERISIQADIDAEAEYAQGGDDCTDKCTDDIHVSESGKTTDKITPLPI